MSLVATFAVIAHNFHAERNWKAELQALSQRHPRVPRRHHRTPTQTKPLAAVSEKKRTARRGPKGLEFLGTPRDGP
jgi:hypothetical protein